jgi:formylglycine-generating enzyme required for sulfatase activity
MKRVGRFIAVIVVLLTGCAAPAMDAAVPVIETGADPEAWVAIPAGPFLLGQHEVETEIDCDYEMMVTDVTNAQYARFLNAALVSGDVKITDNQIVGYYPGDVFHGHNHEREIAAGDWAYVTIGDPALRLDFDGSAFTVKSGYENHPMTMVSWFGARGYCNFSGWRLPTDTEWEKAARGTDNRPFPWGQEIAPESANFVSSHDVFERVFAGAGGTTPVGFYNGETYEGYVTRNAASPYGLYDMAGNVWQWTGDVYEGAHYRNLRGGSHANYAYNLRIWTHNNADPIHTSPSVGFRCARDGN